MFTWLQALCTAKLGAPPWAVRATEQLSAPASVPRTDGLWVSAMQLVESSAPLRPRDSLHPQDLTVSDFSSKLEGSGTLHLAEEVGKEASARPLSELNGAERRAGDMHKCWLTPICKWRGARKPNENPEPFTKLAGQGKAEGCCCPYHKKHHEPRSLFRAET